MMQFAVVIRRYLFITAINGAVIPTIFIIYNKQVYFIFYQQLQKFSIKFALLLFIFWMSYQTITLALRLNVRRGIFYIFALCKIEFDNKFKTCLIWVFYRWESSQKIINCISWYKVLNQIWYRNSCTFKNGCTANNFGIRYYLIAGIHT